MSTGAEDTLRGFYDDQDVEALFLDAHSLSGI
jgi:hypothetical protein